MHYFIYNFKQKLKKSLIYVKDAIGKRILNELLLYYYKIFKSNVYFVFAGKKYFYFYHAYNRAFMNERTVEIPILMDIFTAYKNKKVFELGDVLSNYFDVSHVILDKYTRRQNVINEDIVDYETNEKYDLAIAISTIEHIGFDKQETKLPRKAFEAIDKLKSLLNEKGKLAATFPVGYNEIFDRQLLASGKSIFDSIQYLKRTSRDVWIETTLDEVRDSKYNNPYPAANGLVIAVFQKGS